MHIKTAEELMIPLDNYPHMPYWFSIRQAIIEMEQFEYEINDRRSLPRVVLVFNESYELLGLVRRRDILRGLEPDLISSQLPVNFSEVDTLSSQLPFSFKDMFNKQDAPKVGAEAFEKTLEIIKKRSERPVSDIMVPIKTTVKHDDTLVNIIYEMVEKGLHLIPVIKEGEVTGVVRTVEVLHEVRQLLLD